MAHAQMAPCAAYAHCDSGDARAFPAHLRMPCTKEGDSDCQLLLYLRRTRELLLGASLELVEDQRRPGGLRLAVVPAPASPWPMPCTMDERRKEAALQYAEHLLSEHRCVTAVEINGSMTQPPSLLAALRYNPNVKSVMVRLALDQADEANVNVLHVVNQLTHLEELEFASVNCNTPSRRDTCLKGPLMGRKMEHLSSLDVSVLTLSTETVRRLAWALIWNHTITELVVPKCVFCAYFPSDGYLFSRYLKKKDATLRKLTLKAIGVFKHPGNALPRLVEALCSMTALEELNMDLCMDHEGFAQKIAPFARVVAQNTTLRSLGLPSSACQGCLSSLATLRDFHFPVVEVGVQAVEPWLTALRHTSSLRKLRIDFRTFDQVAFEAFLEVVAMSDSLRSLVITHLPARTDLLKICLEIREGGLRNRVMIADHHVKSMALHSLTECVHIDRVTVNAGHLAFAVMILSNTQPVFSHFKHVTSLRVSCDLFKERNFADLCAYLSSSSVLTDVEISLCIRRLSMTEAQSRSVPCRLSLALASNTNLCSVVIKGLQLGNGDLAALADAARRSRRLTEFRYTSHTAWDSLVTKRHNVLEDPPFSLDSIACVALAEIQKSTHRNASRVSAAARFVLGERDSMEAVLGLELCHDHPHLRQLVMDGSLGNADEAKAMIEKARKKLRRYSLHKFMRAAGVVAQWVECRPQRDGGLQLSDIGEDVWSLICRYLSVADVAETAEPSVDTDLPTNENQSNSFEDSPTTADVPT